MNERKAATLELKADAADGTFRAIFSSFNVIDKDGDVTLPGAFDAGKAVLISQYGHQWGSLPIGKGVLGFDETKAWVDGQLFLDTTAGRDTYATMKAIAELQEFSYGFGVVKASYGQHEGKDVRFLEKLDVFEVSPVMRGAGIGTGLESIKGLSLEDEADGALTATSALVARMKSLAALRAKEGRTLSQANRDRLKRHLEVLAGVQSEISALLEETEPEPKAAAGMTEFLTFQRTISRHLGAR